MVFSYTITVNRPSGLWWALFKDFGSVSMSRVYACRRHCIVIQSKFSVMQWFVLSYYSSPYSKVISEIGSAADSVVKVL